MLSNLRAACPRATARSLLRRALLSTRTETDSFGPLEVPTDKREPARKSAAAERARARHAPQVLRRADGAVDD